MEALDDALCSFHQLPPSSSPFLLVLSSRDGGAVSLGQPRWRFARVVASIGLHGFIPRGGGKGSTSCLLHVYFMSTCRLFRGLFLSDLELIGGCGRVAPASKWLLHIEFIFLAFRALSFIAVSPVDFVFGSEVVFWTRVSVSCCSRRRRLRRLCHLAAESEGLHWCGWS